MHSTRDMAALMKALGVVVKDHVAKAFSALADRIKALEEREPLRGEDGKDGIDGKDGESVAVEDVMPALLAEMHKAIDALPAAKDGADGIDGKDGKDGSSVTIDGVMPMLSAQISKVLDGWERPSDGKDGRDGIDGKDGADGIDGKSFTLEDAELLLDQKMATWALDFEKRAQDTIQRAIDRVPAPKDGRDGIDGKDGVGFDDLRIDYDGDRGFSIVFEKDGREIRHDVRVPVVIDRGVYKSDAAYEKGDGVTHQGSYWIAQSESTAGAPGLSDDWRLAVKKGRDGRHGKDGEKGERGAPGRAAQGI